MKKIINISIRDYLIHTNEFDYNTIIDISIVSYDDKIAKYLINYLDFESYKKRKKIVLIDLEKYHKYINKKERREKLKKISGYEQR